VIQRPAGVGAFEFVILSTLRAAQLMRGCRPRVDGVHKPTIIAQVEVAEGKVKQAPPMPGGPAAAGDTTILDAPAASDALVAATAV
jgi:hypothetical protein